MKIDKFNKKTIKIVIAGVVLISAVSFGYLIGSYNDKENINEGNFNYSENNSVENNSNNDEMNSNSLQEETESTNVSENTDTNKEPDSNVETTPSDTTSSATVETTPNDTTSSTVDSSNQADTDGVTTDEDEVINHFMLMNEDINNGLVSNEENVKDKAKAGFITFVDFVFYDSEINGLTFDELSDKNKKNILVLFKTMDDGVMNYFPNYKEEFSHLTDDTVTLISDLVDAGISNLSDFSKKTLGEDVYNQFIETKDNFIETSGDLISSGWGYITDGFDSGKTYIKDWYENWR